MRLAAVRAVVTLGQSRAFVVERRAAARVAARVVHLLADGVAIGVILARL